MAVTYANALSKHIAFSGLIATRKEGLLKEQLNSEVHYSFLNKKGHFDINALLKLHHFCKKNKIEYIHAHSSSFFWAVLIKMTLPKIKLIWHDHYGNSEFLEQREYRLLSLCSYLFTTIIAVNDQLKKWSESHLNCSRVVYLPNFVNEVEMESLEQSKTFLKGENGKRIVLLANLRPQKNHLFLLRIAKELVQMYPEWTFHLVGKDFYDSYSQELKQKIKEFNLNENVWIYGSKDDIAFILNQATIGVLTSQSEGLPVALLEYGMAKLPIMATAVGEIPSVIQGDQMGFLIQSNDIIDFVQKLKMLIDKPDLRSMLGNNFNKHVQQKYSSEAVIENYKRNIL